MSPVEPRPLVIGTMGLPSSEEMGDLCFLPKRLAAFDSAGANRPPLMAPSAERNARRLQSNFFKFICSFPYEFFPAAANYFSAGAAMTTALPTISIRESPGIHSTAMHARDGALPGEK